MLKNIGRIKGWVGGRKFLIGHGNHDYFSAVPIMRDAGIDAYNLDGNVVEYNGFKFVGFPFVPYFTGEWNYELTAQEMKIEVQKLVDVINEQKIDVLVSHAPLAGILDSDDYGEHCGNSILMNAINYEIEHLPKLYCCGHIHFSQGVSIYKTMLISNAATTQQIIEIF